MPRLVGEHLQAIDPPRVSGGPVPLGESLLTNAQVDPQPLGRVKHDALDPNVDRVRVNLREQPCDGREAQVVHPPEQVV